MKNTIFAFIAILLCFTANSQLITPFSPVISVTQKGDITFAANAITTCTGTGTACTNGRIQIPSAGNTNNQTTGITIGYIDIDGSTGIGAQTFSSSSSTLNIGGASGCGVIYAYLTWGGFVATTTTNYSKKDSIYFQLPGGTTYNKLKADLLVETTVPYNRTYHCYKDVTALVKAGGAGSYTAANIVAATGGNNQFAGWTLVVLYSDPSKALKNLTIFRGLAGVSTGTGAVQFNISGFFTPPSPAPVNVKMGVITFDGDRALVGDTMKFNGVPVSNTKNLQNDIFNSSITNEDAEYARNPSYTNTLGYDADIFTLANNTYTYLGNNASSANIRLSTGGETYLTDIITTAIDVYEPEIRFEKSFVNLNGNDPAQLGDIIEYTLKVRNQGSDPADTLTVTDSLYGALNYIPGSMEILNGPNSGVKTDAIGDDQMEFITAGNLIKARLGVNANSTQGGKITNVGIDSVTTIRFRASITNDCTIFRCTDSVYNMAYATYYGQTAIQKRNTFSSATGIDAGTGCPISGPTGIKVAVPVCTPPADTTFSNCTPYNFNNLIAARPGYTTFLNSIFAPVTQATATGTYYAVKSIYPASYYLVPCNDTIQINFTSTGACILPVKLQEFTVSYNKPSVNVIWVTAQEINNHHFELERSIDGIHFEKIAEIAGAINSSTKKTYSYTDNKFPKFSKLYYRLSEVDLDGIKTISGIRSVVITENLNQVFVIEKIVPNPAKNITNLRIASLEDKVVKIRISDAVGKTVIFTSYNLVRGENRISIDVSRLSQGVYYLEVIDQATGFRSTEKLLRD